MARSPTRIIAGLARGWPKDKAPTLDEATDKAMVGLLKTASPAARAQLVLPWPADGARRRSSRAPARSPRASSPPRRTTSSPKPPGSRPPVAWSTSGPRTPRSPTTLLAMVSPKLSQTLAAALVEAAGRSESPTVGAAIAGKLGVMTPTVRTEAVRALLSRAEWTSALLDGVDKGDVSLSQLSLSQTQALAAHADSTLAARAKVLIARGGGLPDLDRQKVIEAMTPLVLKGGDPAKGKVGLHPAVRQVPHDRRRRGQGRPRPDRHGRAPS